MIENNKQITLQNRSDMMYSIIGTAPFPNRVFESYGATANISYEELKSIANTRGGRVALTNYITIIGEEKEVAEILASLNIYVEHEYFYKADTIKTILLTGSEELLEDTLNFAPQGVLDIIKTISVTMPLSDMNKISMISEHLGIDLMTMIQRAKKKRELNKEEAPKKERKVKVEEENEEEQKETPKAATKSRKAKAEKIDTTGAEDTL